MKFKKDVQKKVESKLERFGVELTEDEINNALTQELSTFGSQAAMPDPNLNPLQKAAREVIGELANPPAEVGSDEAYPDKPDK